MALHISLRAAGILLLSLSMVLSARADQEFSWSYRIDDFRCEGILAVAAADLDADERAELVVVGRNYLEPEAFVEIEHWNGREFLPVWRSGNLQERESSLTALPFTGSDGTLLAVLTRTNYRIIRFLDDTYTEIAAGIVPEEIQSTTGGDEVGAAGDLDGDGQEEIITTTTVANDRNGRQKVLRVLYWQNDKLIPGPASPSTGNIRNLTAGDLDRDGRAEILAEVGLRNEPGSFQIYQLVDGTLQRKGDAQSLLPAAAYGMAIGRLHPEPGLYLFASSQPGRLRGFTSIAGTLRPAGLSLSFSGSPVSLTAGDLDADGRHELILACYPARLQILTPTTAAVGFSINGIYRRTREPARLWDGHVFAEAASMAEMLGWDYSCDEQSITLAFSAGGSERRLISFDRLTLTASFGGQSQPLSPPAHFYQGFIYLPVAQLWGLTGGTAVWHENRLVLELTSP